MRTLNLSTTCIPLTFYSYLFWVLVSYSAYPQTVKGTRWWQCCNALNSHPFRVLVYYCWHRILMFIFTCAI